MKNPAPAKIEEEKVEILPSIPKKKVHEVEEVKAPPILPKLEKPAPDPPSDSIKNTNIDSNSLVMISESDFQGKFSETYYFQKFSETERKPDFTEAIMELSSLFSGTTESMIQKQFLKYKNSEVKAITSVWT